VFTPRDGTRIGMAYLDQMDQLSGWTSFGATDGVGGDQMVSVDCYGSAFAAGSGLEGAYYYYFGPDPFDKADDTVRNYQVNSQDFRYRLPSDIVRVVRFSPRGELWIGSSMGLTKFDLPTERTVTINLPAGFGPNIKALEFDTRDNVWIGSDNGLARIDGATGNIEVFTERTSGLVGDNITNLSLDGSRGDLYICTPSGISVIRSTIGTPTEDVDEVYAFPNPYVITSPDDLLNFNFALNASLRVFAISGELVAQRDEPIWNGRNDAGEPVASGVYLWVLTDEEGNVGRGKILLIRNR
jgi:hypothetical protein